MSLDRIIEESQQKQRWVEFLRRVGVKIGWVEPLEHWGTSIVVGVLVATDHPAVAATVGCLYLAACVYDAQEHILRALFEASEKRDGRSIYNDEDEEEDEE